MLACWRVTPSLSNEYRRGFCCRAEDQQTVSNGLVRNKKKVLVVGSGWAGLGAAHHLSKQGFDVTVLEGGYDSGPNRLISSPDDFGIRGLWYPYRNIFNLVDELGIKPFTNWMKSAQYSGEGLEVEFPIFQDLPQWPTPFGTLFYTEFTRLPWVDRLTSLSLMAAVVDFDNTDTSWRKYDTITARELFRQFGCSERLYEDVFNPLLQVGLFAPAERCSAAATLGILYYYILAHQKDFDLVWCRGTVKKKIFEPWMESMRNQGCKFLEGRRVTDIFVNRENGCISEVICGKESLKADAVILAVGISTLQEIIQNSATLCTREEFLKVMNLATVDLLTAKLKLDRKVKIPNASNACSGFNDSIGWTFFDLNSIYDEHKDDPVTFVQADFFHANELLPLKDDDVAAKVVSYLSRCVKDFENATVIDKEIERFPKSLTHFFPGSYKYAMRGSTSFPNLFMAGDWIITRHGSWSQEKAFVTGLEAANRVVDYLEEGSFARIIPVEEDEPHIQALRSLNRNLNDIIAQLPWSNYFIR
ncbi:Zeta-carotene desaturase [Actinidia chinensis var. chinensis]|uniref:Zeta-carotene desaturase n=1 Tax=Actinidia chinensis var. chinensis TaxID=1590841 RepID=A0A2R6RHP7_ACTCC|nr:Zeta-carotene desaturase [Actinidia chinensis var. chinensis]